ncbi:hypothetical protein ABZW30_15815 [Kitasatospora sp. NPDC004669]|uniref:hypothetical protein n=1 Tax=Kitasatospora sp. NPDC004669 TaxID=3154555 RepID=UPI0033AAC58C
MKSEEPVPRVVLVHGTSAGGTMRHPAMEVAAARHPVPTPDPPGHGSLRGGPFSTPSAAEAATESVAGFEHPGPTWLVSGERDHLRRTERAFPPACRNSRLSVQPGCGRITGLAGTGALARTVLDAAAATAETDAFSASGVR